PHSRRAVDRRPGSHLRYHERRGSVRGHLLVKRVLILVENLPSPFDRRVWQEATALAAAGSSVSTICPTGKGCERRYEEIARVADVSIATNESYRRIAIGRGGMDPSKVHVVRSGPSLERLKIVPPDERLKRGRRYLVGYVGTMGRQEGIDLLLAAAREIVHGLGRRDIHFGLVGGGTSVEEMKQLARRLDVAEFVTFTGRVPDA